MGGGRLILLDTHVLVWLDAADPKLGPKARAESERAQARDGLSVSAISFWEITMLVEKARLSLSQPVGAWRGELLAAGLVERPVDGEVGIMAASLEGFHRDPADRIIAATAALAGAVLMTADDRILQWTGPLRCQDARL